MVYSGESIAKQKRWIFLNFPVMAINRTVLKNNPYKLTEEDMKNEQILGFRSMAN
jgi:hypothetical protein